jgi:subtilisin family serine protease
LSPAIDFADGTGSTKDGLGHGTHVAGIVAQAAPDARIMPVKVLDSQGGAAVATIANGVRWAADHGADVVNLSIDQAGLIAQVQKEGALNAAAKYAYAKGAVVVGAAGNEHQHLQVYKSGVPVITVAAVDENQHPASFTNWGARLRSLRLALESGRRLRHIRPRGFRPEPTVPANSTAPPWLLHSSVALRRCYAHMGRPRRLRKRRYCAPRNQ